MIKQPKKSGFAANAFNFAETMAKNKTAGLPGELLLFSLHFLSLVLFEQLLRLYDAFPKIKNKNIFYLPPEKGRIKWACEKLLEPKFTERIFKTEVLRNNTLFFDKDQIYKIPTSDIPFASQTTA